jgi:hypothetical protein
MPANGDGCVAGPSGRAGGGGNPRQLSKFPFRHTSLADRLASRINPDFPPGHPRASVVPRRCVIHFPTVQCSPQIAPSSPLPERRRFKSRSDFFTFPSQHAPAQPFSIPPERSVRTLNLSLWVVSQGSVAQNKRCIVRDQRAMDLSIQIGKLPLMRTSGMISAPSRFSAGRRFEEPERAGDQGGVIGMVAGSGSA